MKRNIPKKVISRREALGIIAAGSTGAASIAPEELVGLGFGPSRYNRHARPQMFSQGVDDYWMDELVKEVAEKKVILKRVKETGIPDHKKKELWIKAYDSVRSIHPNIANLNSVSLGHKFRMQALLNYNKAVDALGADLNNEIEDLLYRIRNKIEINIW
jgi:hypothetical protein